MSLSKLALVIVSLSLFSACVEQPESNDNTEMMVDADLRYEQSSSAGNLIATAIQKENDLDFAFVPSESLTEGSFALLKPEMDKDAVGRRLIRLFDENRFGTYKIGTIKGKAIKKFVLGRALEMLRHDIHVAGLRYHVKLRGGLPTIFQITKEDGSEIEDDRIFRIAVEKTSYSSFPGYWYRHGFSRAFRWEMGEVDALESLENYLSKTKNLAPFHDVRSKVDLLRKSEIPGLTAISSVQGFRHLSPLHAHVVTVQGVVTAFGQITDGFHKGRYEAYIQSIAPDNDPRTSEALYVDLGKDLIKGLAKGSLIEVKGVVYEDLVNEGLTKTGLRELESVRVIETVSASMPEPVVLGANSVKVPSERISSFRGNVNKAPSLNLDDGLDFWESLEGMKVLISTPTVVGFSGGRKDYQPDGRAKGYINIFVTAEGTESETQKTPSGGLIIDNVAGDYNPEIIRITDHHLAPGMDPKMIFEVGDKFSYDLEGILAYNQNLFGSGEYSFLVTGEVGSLSEEKGPLEKPKTSFLPSKGDLTVATFNVENLSASDRQYRFERIGQSISHNLQCPDIVNLVEIQDDSGAYDRDSAPRAAKDGRNTSAKRTLEKLIAEINSCPIPADYKAVDIDPIENQEGGEPGGNIRVAMIYNSLRVSFEGRREARGTDENYLDDNGSLFYNPGRVAASDSRLSGTRKPLIAEFGFRGEKVFVIGNHFNSKGGDTSLWAAQQPPKFGSESRRTQIADAVNDFVQGMLIRYPDANVIVTGDFNDFNDSRALKVLEGTQLKNLANVIGESGEPLVEANDQYTYNYGGNSQALDFILASPNLLKKNPQIEILHINTDYMLQVADHDPIISKYSFD